MLKKISWCLILLLLAATAALAHDAWIDQRDGEFVVLYGHGDDLGKYELKHLQEVKAYDQAGSPVAAEVKPHAKGAAIAPATTPALITMIFDEGVWVKTPEGYKHISKSEAKSQGKEVLSSLKGKYFSKNYWRWHDAFGKPLGFNFEVVPLKNPLAAKVGESLPIQVLYQGKPKAGIEVGYSGAAKDEKPLKTDQDGKAAIVLKKSGRQLISASYKEDLQNDPEADTLWQSANITFETPYPQRVDGEYPGAVRRFRGTAPAWMRGGFHAGILSQRRAGHVAHSSVFGVGPGHHPEQGLAIFPGAAGYRPASGGHPK
ncbi:MAG: DUF4198 domain-containing protein [Desulfobaccales bacterium]